MSRNPPRSWAGKRKRFGDGEQGKAPEKGEKSVPEVASAAVSVVTLQIPDEVPIQNEQPFSCNIYKLQNFDNEMLDF